MKLLNGKSDKVLKRLMADGVLHSLSSLVSLRPSVDAEPLSSSIAHSLHPQLDQLGC